MIDWFLYYSVELANALAGEHDVLLVTRDHNFEISSLEAPLSLDEFLDDNLNDKVGREQLKYRRRSWKNFWELIRISKKIKDFKPDIIHIQENTDWRIYLIVKIFGFEKVVLTVHDVVIHPGEKGGLFSFVRRALRNNCSRIIVHGNYLREELSNNLKKKRNRVFTVPHGVLSIYKKWGNIKLPEEGKTILFFGRAKKYKGIDVLIRAEPLISKEVPEVKIIIAGQGESLALYADQLSQNSRFEIHNRFIPNTEVHKFFQRAALVVLPYIEASQSGVIPIAYSFGKPVVATDVGSIPEVIEEGKTGYIVPSNNPERLAEAVIKILKDRELRKFLGMNALKKTQVELCWSNIAEKTLKIYSSIKKNA